VEAVQAKASRKEIQLNVVEGWRASPALGTATIFLVFFEGKEGAEEAGRGGGGGGGGGGKREEGRERRRIEEGRIWIGEMSKCYGGKGRCRGQRGGGG
jgi:hypothetical protein